MRLFQQQVQRVQLKNYSGLIFFLITQASIIFFCVIIQFEPMAIMYLDAGQAAVRNKQKIPRLQEDSGLYLSLKVDSFGQGKQFSPRNSPKRQVPFIVLLCSPLGICILMVKLGHHHTSLPAHKREGNPKVEETSSLLKMGYKCSVHYFTHLSFARSLSHDHIQFLGKIAKDGS